MWSWPRIRRSIGLSARASQARSAASSLIGSAEAGTSTSAEPPAGTVWLRLGVSLDAWAPSTEKSSEAPVTVQLLTLEFITVNLALTEKPVSVWSVTERLSARISGADSVGFGWAVAHASSRVSSGRIFNRM